MPPLVRKDGDREPPKDASVDPSPTPIYPFGGVHLDLTQLTDPPLKGMQLRHPSVERLLDVVRQKPLQARQTGADGKMHKVWVMQRDFRSVQGLMIPFVCETVVEGYPQTHALTLETVVVNRALDDARFTKAQMLAAAVPAPPAAAPVAVNH